MATKDLINLGTAPDTGTGDSARSGGTKINTLFVDTYNTLGDFPLNTDTSSISYGQKQVSNTTDYVVGELRPAGQWKTFVAEDTNLSTVNTTTQVLEVLRGEQITLDLGDSNFTASAINIILPLANPGDIIKIRDIKGTWSESKRVFVRTSALNPLATGSTWNLFSEAEVGHVNINSVPFSNMAITADSDTNGYASNISKTTTGYLLQTAFSDVEFVYIDHSRGWRATVRTTSVSAPSIIPGTIVYGEPFYNTRNYSNAGAAAEQSVYYTEFGTTLAGDLTTITDLTTRARRKACNTIIVDQNWILNADNNGIILNDEQLGTATTNTSLQWTIYVALPSSSRWTDIVGQNLNIINNSSIPVVIKPLVVDNTAAATRGLLNETDTTEFAKWTTLDTVNDSSIFAGLDKTGLYSLNNYAWIDGEQQFGDTEYFKLQYNVNDNEAAALAATPLNLQKSFDPSIQSITLSFTADSTVPADVEQKGWRITNTEYNNNTRRQRTFVIVDDATGVTADKTSRNNYITSNQASPVYLSTVAASTINFIGTGGIDLNTADTSGVPAGPIGGGSVKYIATGEEGLDPITNADDKISYTGLEVYVDGVLLTEGTDWKSFTANRNPVDSNPTYQLINANTNFKYGFADNEITRATDLNAIELTTPLIAGQNVELHWYPIISISSSLRAAVQDVVSQGLVTSANNAALTNQIEIGFFETSNVLANFANTNVSFWQNEQVTLAKTSGGVLGTTTPTGGWYFSIGNTTPPAPVSTSEIHRLGLNPRVTVQEDLTAANAAIQGLVGFEGDGHTFATPRINIDNAGNIFVSADAPFTGRIIIYT